MSEPARFGFGEFKNSFVCSFVAANAHLNSGLVQFGGPRQFLPAVYVWIMRFRERRFQFCQLLLRNNWKAVVKADLNYPAGNLNAIRKIRVNRNVIIDQRVQMFLRRSTCFRDIFARRNKSFVERENISEQEGMGGETPSILFTRLFFLFFFFSIVHRCIFYFVRCVISFTRTPTCVKVVLCRRRAGVGQLAVVGV